MTDVRRFKPWFIVVLLLVLSLVVWRVAFFKPGGGRPVLVVGDSILVLSGEATKQALEDDGWKPIIEAHSGSSLQGGMALNWPLKVKELVAQHHPKFAVVELGTNGCGACSDSDPGAAIDEIMTALAGIKTVLWLNVREGPPLPKDAAGINRGLDEATKRWPNLTIVDFDRAFENHPDWILPDDLHPTEAGAKAYAELIKDALADHARRLPL